MNLTIWPYHSGNPAVDCVLFALYLFAAGYFFGLGWRVAGKLP